MRSRYSAYVRARADYLLRTWHETTRPDRLDFRDAENITWLGLKIIRTEAGGPNDMQGVVEFVTRHKIGGRAHRIVETSRFVKENGCWFYLDGMLTQERRGGKP